MYPVSVITAAPLVALGRFETRRQWRTHARRALRVHLCVASAQESTVYKVAGMGGAGLDYLAVVSAYPKPDQKIRTESFEVYSPLGQDSSLACRFRVVETAAMR